MTTVAMPITLANCTLIMYNVHMHITFEGHVSTSRIHVTLNEEQYRKSVQLKFRYCLGAS